MDGPAFYDGDAVDRLLEPAALLDRLAAAFVYLSRGRVVAPSRIQLDTAKGFSLAMPAHRPGGPFAVKIVNVFEENRALGLPSHQVLCGAHAVIAENLTGLEPVLDAQVRGLAVEVSLLPMRIERGDGGWRHQFLWPVRERSRRHPACRAWRG